MELERSNVRDQMFSVAENRCKQLRSIVSRAENIKMRWRLGPTVDSTLQGKRTLNWIANEWEKVVKNLQNEKGMGGSEMRPSVEENWRPRLRA